jgi:YidC/Oxa1 family membrane protein insertase
MFSIFSEFKRVQKLVDQKFNIIFFVETHYYFQYIEHLFNAFAGQKGVRIAYISSDKQDPVLQDKRVEGFYLNATLAGAFPKLQADVMVMTMPDLQNFLYKRSERVGKYIYVFHALVSTHQQYRENAFDYYDAVFCTGPQQVEEISKRELLFSLPPKELVSYGYPFLEQMKSQPGEVPLKKILVAPSWYEEGLLNQHIFPLLEIFKNIRMEIWLRPHPEFIKRKPKQWKKIEEQSAKGSIHIDLSPSVYNHFSESAILITDRSGIAFEFAFSTGRPVIFIDTPLKQQNHSWQKLNIEPLENRFRYQVGKAVLPGAMNELAGYMNQLQTLQHEMESSIKDTETKMVFNKEYHSNGINYINDHLRF